MGKNITKFVGVILLLSLSLGVRAEERLKPFVLAYKTGGDMAGVVAEVKQKLGAGGFEVVGTYSPYPSATVIAVTDDELRKAAAKSEFGGYGAAQRVAVTQVNGEFQVSYTNPLYMAQAYRMGDDLHHVAEQLTAALGNQGQFGPDEGIEPGKLRKYHYMFGMEYFDDPSELAEYGSYQQGVDTVEANLAKGVAGVTKVYRVDIPGKDETVFGVAMKGAAKENKAMDDRYIMSEIDFKPLRSTAHLPYEILVSGNKAYALYARFRIAVDFPDLSMMGKHSFMNIMDSPKAIEQALTLAAGGQPEVDAWK